MFPLAHLLSVYIDFLLQIGLLISVGTWRSLLNIEYYWQIYPQLISGSVSVEMVFMFNIFNLS